MRCEEVNLLDYVEGVAHREVAAHIEACRRCRRQSERMMRFSVVASRYSEGKKAEGELEGLLKAINGSTMERLPVKLQKKITELKEKSLVSKIKKVFAGTGDNERKFIEEMRSPRLQVTMASPKDITRARKRSKRRTKK